MCKIDPIISPWIFYAISVVSGLQSVFVAGATILIVMLSWYFFKYIDEFEKNRVRISAGKTMEKFAIALAILGATSIFIPSEQTMYKMLIANYITPNNIEYIHETVKGDMNDALNVIADKVIEAQKEVNNP